jgi:hypothetical protein
MSIRSTIPVMLLAAGRDARRELDTNIIVSGFGWGGVPGLVLGAD